MVGGQAAIVRRTLVSIRDELTPVDIESRPALALTEDVDAMRSTAPPRGSVRLLPGFDTYVMGSAPRTSVVPEAFTARVSRAAGWIAPVVLVDGVAAGVWKAERAGAGSSITMEPFGGGPNARLRRGVEREATRLEPCLGPIIDVRFAPED